MSGGKAVFLFEEPVSVSRGQKKTFQIIGDVGGEIDAFIPKIESLSDDLFVGSDLQE